MDAFMRDSDAFSWYMERDPGLRSTVVAVAFVGGDPDWAVVRDRIELASRRIPLFRERVLEPPGRLANPRWTADRAFDLDWHLRRMPVPEPGGLAGVVAFACGQASTAFDRSRPLWRFTLLDGVGEGSTALVMKVHHALTDGVGGMQLALLLFDVTPEPGLVGWMPDAPRSEHVEGPRLLAESLTSRVARFVDLAGGGARSLWPTTWQALRRPGRTVGDLVETARSIGRTVAPIARTLSPVMTGRGTGRHLEVVEVALDDLHRAGVVAGGTVNDAFVAAVTGGLRRYHERHGAAVERLRVTMPVNIRHADDPAGGNRITLLRFTVPVTERDPARRIPEIDRLCRRVRAERSIPYTNGIAGVLNLLPARLLGPMLKRVDFLASDVPGFPFPVYLGGAPLERYVAFGPTTGTAVNLTLLSYNGRCSVGVTIDTDAVPDTDELADCLREGFDEVLDLAQGHGPAHLPLHERSAAA